MFVEQILSILLYLLTLFQLTFLLRISWPWTKILKKGVGICTTF